MIYDYKCLICGDGFQLDVPMTTRIIKGKHLKARCPHCKTRRVKKVIHRAEIVFKGTGFYSTDSVTKK